MIHRNRDFCRIQAHKDFDIGASFLAVACRRCSAAVEGFPTVAESF